MTEELKNDIKNFIIGYINTVNDESFGLEDYDFWLESAIELLSKTIGENCSDLD